MMKIATWNVERLKHQNYMTIYSKEDIGVTFKDGTEIQIREEVARAKGSCPF
ncbi:hypothetical protein SAMN05660648_00364 [Selenomonas ruminantium]|uniref:Uncharacterized protein n=1 Tax=Selenomonas ruminantium TaxID=971 RepID=A0A1H3VMR2_SELRU|nr:hypothetical protein SAMN05660648_00364 [Selenomonas ruminantium]